jgi:hypothetical protein
MYQYLEFRMERADMDVAEMNVCEDESSAFKVAVKRQDYLTANAIADHEPHLLVVHPPELFDFNDVATYAALRCTYQSGKTLGARRY